MSIPHLTFFSMSKLVMMEGIEWVIPVLQNGRLFVAAIGALHFLRRGVNQRDYANRRGPAVPFIWGAKQQGPKLLNAAHSVNVPYIDIVCHFHFDWNVCIVWSTIWWNGRCCIGLIFRFWYNFKFRFLF